jgi:hypothetical protein
MDARFDAAQPRAPVAAPAPAAPRPAEAPWARAWAHEWQQVADAKDNPAAAGAGDVRVAWRDASAASTWLAPVRAREELRPEEERQAAQPSLGTEVPMVLAPPATTPGKKASPPHDAPASPELLFMPATQPVALSQPATRRGHEPALQADAKAAPPVALAASRLATADLTSTTAMPSARAQPIAPDLANRSAAPRTPPPSRPGEARPFAPTHLQITPGEDGPAVWLRDARLSPGGQATSRVLQALASLGWPHTLRPGALFLNGRPLGPTPSTRALPPQGHPDTLPPLKEEDPHGH